MNDILNYWKIFIDSVKDVAVLVGFIAGIAALIKNWKPIFSPYKHKKTEEEFSTVKELMDQLLQPEFLIFYNSPVRRKDFHSLVNILTLKLISPFLPNEIKSSIREMSDTLIKGWDGNIIAPNNENDILEIDYKILVKYHEELLRKCAKILRIDYTEFPFTVFDHKKDESLKKGTEPVNSADAKSRATD